MSDPKRRCYDLMAEIFLHREECLNEDEVELELIDQLDAAWLQLSRGDRDEVNRMSAQIACGLLTPMDFAQMLSHVSKDKGVSFVRPEQISRHSDSREGPLLEWKPSEVKTVSLGAPTYALGQR